MSWDVQKQQYKATLTIAKKGNGQKQILGLFDTEKDAGLVNPFFVMEKFQSPPSLFNLHLGSSNKTGRKISRINSVQY